jgi:DNA-binding NtrC family response regulator
MPRRANRARILVVDDDEGVREFIAEVLAEKDHEVIAVPDAIEALAVLERSGDGIDLLVTDVVMPGLNGFSLASLVKGRWPRIKILYVTGYYDLARSDMGERFGSVLKKPFRPRQLRAEVTRALAA